MGEDAGGRPSSSPRAPSTPGGVPPGVGHPVGVEDGRRVAPEDPLVDPDGQPGRGALVPVQPGPGVGLGELDLDGVGAWRAARRPAPRARPRRRAGRRPSTGRPGRGRSGGRRRVRSGAWALATTSPCLHTVRPPPEAPGPPCAPGPATGARRLRSWTESRTRPGGTASRRARRHPGERSRRTGPRPHPHGAQRDHPGPPGLHPGLRLAALRRRPPDGGGRAPGRPRAPPTGSTATSPGASTRSRPSARSSTRWPTGSSWPPR